MIYADWYTYTSVYMGRGIEESEFPRFAMRASQYLDYCTNGKSRLDPEHPALKMACCAIAEQYQVMDAAEETQIRAASDAAPDVKSESVGSYSVTYGSRGERASAAASLAAQQRRRLWDTAVLYLAGTGLLYRGGKSHVYTAHHNAL